MDIFKGWDNYVELLEQHWQETVGEDDAIVIAGDISWGMSLEEALPDLQFIDRLNGREKILLKGNHDYWWNTRSKMEVFFAENGLSTLRILHNNAYPCGDVCVCGTRGWINDTSQEPDRKVLLREAGRLRASLVQGQKAGKRLLVFLHYPPVFATDRNEEILKVLEEFGVSECYYGHIHGRGGFSKAVTGERDGVHYRLISCDYVQFCPVQVL